MDVTDLIGQAEAMRARIAPYANEPRHGSTGPGAKAQVCEFLRAYAGSKSSFLRQAETAQGFPAAMVTTLDAVLQAFIEYLQAGLASGPSPERRAQLDVVSDIMQQAHAILENPRQHPAAAAVLVGASLEEFLRTWVESAGLSIGDAKPGIDAYAKALRTADLITKQDVKDVTAWAGVRNHAAHGEWELVADRSRIGLMLEGVNLFMRQKGA